MDARETREETGRQEIACILTGIDSTAAKTLNVPVCVACFLACLFVLWMRDPVSSLPLPAVHCTSAHTASLARFL